MNRRSLLLGMAGGIGVRVNKPSLVVPGLVNHQHEADQLGITRIKTIGQQTTEVASEKLRGGKPIVVAGGTQEDEALPALLDALHQQGVIRNETTTGMQNERIPTFDTLRVTGLMQVDGLLFVEGGGHANDGFFIPLLNVSENLAVQQIEANPFPAPSIAATPVGTFPGAGTSPSVVNINGGDLSGWIQITTGTGTAAGDVCRVTFGTPKQNTNFAVILFPRSNAARTDIGKINIDSINTTSWDINASPALAASTAYQWSYIVI